MKSGHDFSFNYFHYGKMECYFFSLCVYIIFIGAAARQSAQRKRQKANHINCWILFIISKLNSVASDIQIHVVGG